MKMKTESRKNFGKLLCVLPLVFTLQCMNSQAARYPGDRSNYDNQTSPIFETDPFYTEECAACHLGYAPGLLPASSWMKILHGLENHFGENADLDSETVEHLADYLKRNSLEHETSERIARFKKNLPSDPPIRITELPEFLKEHEPAVRQIGLDEVETGFFSPCEDCHKAGAS